MSDGPGERAATPLRPLVAYPVTPLTGGGDPDEDAVSALVASLVASGAEALGVLGSTGGYAYLDADERRRTATAAVAAAGGVPVLVGVGALTTRDVLRHAEAAAAAGASAVLLAPVSYQPLLDDEVVGLYTEVAAASALPVVAYDNPVTTGVPLADGLLARVAAVPGVVGVKVPAAPADPAGARTRTAALRRLLPEGTALGVSGYAPAVEHLLAGCDGWHSTLAGVLPRACLRLVAAARAGDADGARALSSAMAPAWALGTRYGGVRAASALAVEQGLVPHEALRRPLLPLTGAAREEARAALAALSRDDLL